MIYKNVKFHKSQDTTILQFGQGDIFVAAAKDDDPEKPHAFVVFMSGTPGEVGREEPGYNGKTAKDVSMDVVLAFDTAESIDVVIEQLVKAKEHLKTNHGPDTNQ